MKTKLHIVLIFTLSLVWLMVLQALCLGATYYVDATKGQDSYPGTKELPWRTIKWAEEHAANGSTIYLATGNYGEVTINRTGLNRTSWDDGVTYKADSGENPVFTKLTISQDVDRYIEFNDISIIQPAVSATGAVGVRDSDYVRLINLDVYGVWLEDDSAVSTGGISLGNPFNERSINNILVEGCEIKDFIKGIFINGAGNNIVIRNNHVHHLVSSAISLGAYNGNNDVILIEGNHIHDQNDIFAAHGSGLSIRASNVTVRGNIIHHYGNTAGITTYPINEPFTNMLFENNLVYEAISRAVLFNNIATNFVVRNNTFASVHAYFATGYDGSGLYFYNNVLFNTFTVWYDSYLPLINEGNNIMWAIIIRKPWGYRDYFTPESNSLIARTAGYPDYASYFGNGFFVDYDSHDYRLAANSPAIGFANPAHAPATDLLGNPRDASPDAGCYEYVREGGPDEAESDKAKLKCYNNVFNPTKGEKALIWVELPKQAHIKISLYNTRGNRIRELADEKRDAGTRKYHWDGKDDSGDVVGSGLYFVHIEAGDYKKTKKIVVIK